jgi:hypothetical protein
VPALQRRRRLPQQLASQLPELLVGLRGGAGAGSTAAQDDEGASESEEGAVGDDEDEEDEDVDEVDMVRGAFDASLSASAVKAAEKTKSKQEASRKVASKKAVSEVLKDSKSPASSSKKKIAVAFFRVPYIVRACLNPATALRMTAAYWASLFNLDFLKRDDNPASELRSALQEKARSDGGGSKKRGKRTMKRGQSKTLSDLPQLGT